MVTLTRSITRLQDADDTNVSLGPGTNGYSLVWDNAASEFTLSLIASSSPAGSGTELQYRSGSNFGAIPNTAWNGVDLTLPSAITLSAPVTIKPSVDSSAAIKIQDANGTSNILTLDTVNGRHTIFLKNSSGQSNIFVNASVPTSAGNNAWGLSYPANGTITLGFFSGAGITWIGGGAQAIFSGTWSFPSNASYPSPVFLASNNAAGNDVRLVCSKSGNGPNQRIYLYTQRFAVSDAPPSLDIDGGQETTFFTRSNTTAWNVFNASVAGIVRHNIGWNFTSCYIGDINTSPTAFLDIAPSSSSKASLRIRSGVAPTTPNNGDLWSDGVDLFIRLNSMTYKINLTLA